MEIGKIEFMRREDLEETKFLLYVKGYKYQSRNNMIYKTEVRPKVDIITDLIILKKSGWIWISKYFAWDGCSGPTYDDATNMKAGQVHDALYALGRMGYLSPEDRDGADRTLENQMLKDGALKIRARYYYLAVKKFAKKCFELAKKIFRAPF